MSDTAGVVGPARTVEAIIFDAEGVTVDTETLWDIAQTELLARRGRIYDRERTKRHLTGRSSAEGIRIIADEYGLTDDLQLLAAERLEIMNKAADQVEFIPGFRSFYEEARRNYRTALATAMDPGLFALVDARLGLTQLFDGNVFLVTVGIRAKPNPDLFLLAARSLGVPPSRCLVFEDAPHGVEAAHRAGMLCIGLATTYDPELLAHSDLVAGSYEQIDLEAFLSEYSGSRGPG